MQEAVPVGEGSMIAVLGMTIDQMKTISKRSKLIKLVKLLMIIQLDK